MLTTRKALAAAAVTVIALIGASAPVGAQETSSAEAAIVPPAPIAYAVVGPCTPAMARCTVAAYAYDRTNGEWATLEVALSPLGPITFQTGPHPGTGFVRVSLVPSVPKNMRFCGYFFTVQAFSLSQPAVSCARVDASGRIVYG
jgi:hypothetical protein